MPPCHANLEKNEFVPKKTHKPNAKEFHYKDKEIATISVCYCHEYEKNDRIKSTHLREKKLV
jgi:hypothetical protein